MKETLKDEALRVEIQRSRLLLAACNGIIDRDYPEIGSQVQVDLRPQGTSKWQMRLFASDSPSSIDAVASREVDLAIVNPSAALTLAYRGTGWFKVPIPVRAITVMPQRDCVGVAVDAKTGLNFLEDVATQKYPLRISLRGQRSDHAIHPVLADIMGAAGCPIHAVDSWGGRVSYDPGLPTKHAGPAISSRIDLVKAGARDAVFDEAFPTWGAAALDAGMKFLSLRESTLQRLTEMGYRRHTIDRSVLTGVDGEIETIDFSGWPLFCHADTPDRYVLAFCEGLEEHKATIPWEDGEGPLPLERLCRSPEEAPLDVPLHPAAESFWRDRGYLVR